MTTDAFRAAFDRLEDFLAVQSDADGRIAPEPVLRLQEAVGVDAALRDELTRRLRRIQPTAPAAAVLLGVIVGLSAAQLEREREEWLSDPPRTGRPSPHGSKHRPAE
jgi:hypothetical protein